MPFVLVGTKSDLKEESPHLAVETKAVKAVMKKLKPYDWVECSAIMYKNRELSNIDLAFKTAISCVLEGRLGTYSRSCCTLL